MAIVGRSLYYFGGLGSDLKGRTTMWRMNLNNVAAGWVTDTPIPDSCNHMGCVVINGLIYAVGGLHDKLETTSNQSHVQVFNPATDRWSLAAPLPVGIGHIQPATCIAGNEILVAGGQENSSGPNDNDNPYLYEYNPVTNSWSTLAKLPDPRKSAFVGYVGGKIIFYGGNILPYPYLTYQVYVGY